MFPEYWSAILPGQKTNLYLPVKPGSPNINDLNGRNARNRQDSQKSTESLGWRQRQTEAGVPKHSGTFRIWLKLPFPEESDLLKLCYEGMSFTVSIF